MSEIDDDWSGTAEYDGDGPSPNGQLGRIAFGGGHWLAPRADGKVSYATSPEGPWTTVTVSPSDARGLYAAHYADGRWVVVGRNGLVVTATDPAGTWSVATMASGVVGAGDDTADRDGSFYAVAYGGGTWVAAGKNRIVYATTASGTWNLPSSVSPGPFNGVAYGGGYWVVSGEIAGGQHRYATTPSGTWTLGEVSGMSTMQSVAYADGAWLVVGSNSGGGAKAATTSTPGTTWSDVSLTGTNLYTPYHAAHLDGLWVLSGEATGFTGEIAYATDLSGSWTTAAQGVSLTRAVAFGEGEWALGTTTVGTGALGVVFPEGAGDGWGLLL